MDLYKIIKELHADLARINHLIAILEQMQPGKSTAPARTKRGRKAMSETEKREVSRRMKAYWAAKNKKQPPE
jgi:hypothetical protein